VPRPSSGTNMKLLAAGRRLVAQDGLSGLNIREVCKKANVNLGMFHYHFKTKKNFEHALFKDIYADFISRFRLETDAKVDPFQRLRKALCALGRFARDNRTIIAVIGRDIINGKEEMISFARRNFTLHVKIVVGLIEECQRSGLIRKMSLPSRVSCLVLPVVIPCAAIGVMEKIGAGKHLPIPLLFLKRTILSDVAIEERVEMVLRGVAKPANAGNK